MTPFNSFLFKSLGRALLAMFLWIPIAQAQDPSGQAPGPVTSWSPAEALDLMRQMGLPLATDDVLIHYSAGFESRALALGGDLAAAVDFYERHLGVRPDVVLAVLDETDWPQVTPVPYGFPHWFQGARSVVFLGATPENPAVIDMRSRHGHASDVDREKVRRAGMSWDEASGRFLDLVGYHELGHIYTHALGIEPHRRWFSEMLATYIGYAFMKSERPEQALVWEGVIASLPASPPPAHITLADFEELYVNVGIPNYQWYQGIFNVRAEEVFAAQGIDFVLRVRDALPAGASGELSTQDLLDRLERIQPGFHAWATRFGLLTHD